jgi:signal transduction histidine kinase
VVSGPDLRPSLDPTVEEHLYRIALEALNNALKHAHATQISVAVANTESGLTVTISDDGTGFDASERHPGHLGQSTMYERAAAIGAMLRVSTAPGKGCAVTVTQPASAQRTTRTSSTA